MSGSVGVPTPDAHDADAIAAAVLACPAVAALHEGGARAVATYLPHRRVVGVRIEDQRVLVSVVLAPHASVRSLAAQVRRALAPLVGETPVDVHVADIRLTDAAPEERGADALAK